MSQITVVAPAYNEEENIEPFLRRVAETLKKEGLQGDVIVVDDGSTDNTGKILRILSREMPFLKIIHSPKRMGITSSLRKAYDRATGDYIIFLPSDLESDPAEDIPKLLQALHEGYDVAAGWRHNKTEGKIKIISSKLFNWVAHLLFGIQVHDLGWVKGFRREILEDMEPLRSDWHRFFVIFAAERGFKIKEIPTNFYPRKHGESKFGKTGFGRALGAFIDLLAVKFLLSFSKRPLRVFGTTGIAFFLLGFAAGAYLTYIKLAVGTIGNRIPLLFLAVFLMTMGIQLFAFGFLAEMVASIKDRMRG